MLPRPINLAPTVSCNSRPCDCFLATAANVKTDWSREGGLLVCLRTDDFLRTSASRLKALNMLMARLDELWDRADPLHYLLQFAWQPPPYA